MHTCCVVSLHARAPLHGCAREWHDDISNVHNSAGTHSTVMAAHTGAGNPSVVASMSAIKQQETQE
eukprot:6694465-Alexandrium_andersonii.AAC.1